MGNLVKSLIVVTYSLDDYNRLVTLCNGTNEGVIQRGIMERSNATLPTMTDVRSCLGIRDFDSPPYFTNSSFSFRYSGLAWAKLLNVWTSQLLCQLWFNKRFAHRNALEGYDKPDGQLDQSVNNLHNLVHSLLNGTSALSHSAANDPIFLVRFVFTAN